MRFTFKIAVGAATLTSLLPRLWAVPHALADTDAVDFALAREHFDVAALAPHFPGYPLYVLAVRLFFFAPPTWALALPAIVATAAVIPWAARTMARAHGAASGATLAWLLALAPPLVALAAEPRADGLALALLGAALLAGLGACNPRPWSESRGQNLAGDLGSRLEARRRAAIVSGLLLAAALGVRPSYAPLVPSLLLALLVASPRAGRRVLWVSGAALVGCLLWFIPFLLYVGISQYFAIGAAHLQGHFTTFGGVDEGGVALRALRVVQHAAAGLWPLAVAALLIARGNIRAAGRAAVVIFAISAPYFIFVVFAQHAGHARHAAPLTLAALPAIALLARGPRSGAILVAATALGVLLAPSTLKPPNAWRAEAVRAIVARFGHEQLVIAGTHLPRVARFYAPELRTLPARTSAEVLAAARTLGPAIALVVSSEVNGIDHDPQLALEPLAQFDGGALYRARAASPASATAASHESLSP